MAIPIASTISARSLAYSPLHNVRAGVTYPPLLVLTADHDDRVSPAHAYKFVATMQDRSPASETYLRVERQAGHWLRQTR